MILFFTRPDGCTRTRRTSIAALLCALLLTGCGSAPVRLPAVMPENVALHPIGRVGVVTLAEPASLSTSIRALGVPFRRVPVDSLRRHDLSDLSFVIVDERALDDPRVDAGIFALFEYARTGGRLILLQQQPEAFIKLLPRTTETVLARPVEYAITLRTPMPEHPLLNRPNAITAGHLDSLSRGTRQLAQGSANARAILAGNLDRPDSSAALLREPMGRGVVWYIAFPVATRAALGYEAEQKLLANLLSHRDP